jgi:hypothetical protein
MALDDRCRAPVLTGCNLPEPATGRHAMRTRTGRTSCAVPNCSRHRTEVSILWVVVVCSHLLVSRAALHTPGHDGRWGVSAALSFPDSFPWLPLRGVSRGESVPEIPHAGMFTVTRGRVFWFFCMCRRTNTLIRKSAHRAHKFVKYGW